MIHIELHHTPAPGYGGYRSYASNKDSIQQQLLLGCCRAYCNSLEAVATRIMCSCAGAYLQYERALSYCNAIALKLRKHPR